MRPGKRAALAALVVAAVPFRGFAADGLRGANTLAQGGAAVGLLGDNSALAANPALLGLTERYDIAGTFGLDLTGDLGWHMSAVDSSKGQLAFGMAWQRTIEDPPLTADEYPGWVLPDVEPSNLRRSSVFTAGGAVALNEDRTVSLGISGNMGRVTHDRLGQGLVGDLDVGFGWRPSEFVTLGLVGQSLLPIKGPTPQDAAVLAGVRYAIEDGPSVGLDLGWQLEDAAGLGLLVRGGAEGAIGLARPRLGFLYDGPFRQAFVTGGIGAQNEAGAVEYAIVVPVTDFEAKAMQHFLTVRFSVQ